MPSKNEAAQMVTSVEPMVRGLAARFARISGGRVDAVELAQLGRVAAFAATVTFDPKAGAQFSTYAFTAIRNAMGNEIRKANTATVSLDAPVGDDDGECYLDGLPADGIAADEALEHAEREATVRRIVAAVKAEHFAAKPELFDAVVARLMAAVEVLNPAHNEASTFRSELTLESIAIRFGCTREWVRRTESTVKARLEVALSEVA